MADTQVGEVIHFYDKIQVAIVRLTKTLKVGDTIKFKLHDQEVTQPVESMELDHQKITTAPAGDEIGIKVNEPIKPKAQVF
ncbi:MAG: translation elongation factor-like protein, partial [Candidatus Chisholmbacteria bacterium]|nr:translation elongation factor-like protein [Candidatus Chisholmbacteria bacterium]